MQVISVRRGSSVGWIGTLSSPGRAIVSLTTKRYSRPRETAMISSPGSNSSRRAKTLPASPFRWPIRTVFPSLRFAVWRSCPTTKAGGSQVVGTTAARRPSRGIARARAGPGRGLGATVSGRARPISAPSAGEGPASGPAGNRRRAPGRARSPAGRRRRRSPRGAARRCPPCRRRGRGSRRCAARRRAGGRRGPAGRRRRCASRSASASRGSGAAARSGGRRGCAPGCR